MIAALCTAACSLAACRSSCRGEDEFYKYEQLNSILKDTYQHYSQISLTVTDTFGEDISLESKYTIKKSENEITVEYRVERFSILSLDDPATEVKTVYEGTATIKEGMVTGGEDVGINADIATPHLTFMKQYFENATLTALNLSADVVNPSEFLGADLTCTDMKVYAEFLAVFSSIKINYTENGNKVQYLYQFTI